MAVMINSKYGYEPPEWVQVDARLDKWHKDKKRRAKQHGAFSSDKNKEVQHVMTLMKHCNWGGCNKVVSKDQSFCNKHEAMNEQRKANYKASLDQRSQTVAGKQVCSDHQAYYNHVRRDQEANTFYHTKQWQNVRDYVYARDMATCRVCGNAVTDRKIVDHIHPLKVSGEERLSQDNLWTLCYRCHNIKTNLEIKIAAKDNGNAILKHAKREWWQKIISDRFK
ncbi:HNH endonuclease [Pediococcus acidilactici]|uniref:HNH endonuclease n=1 Tax=Pediococcus acidilactici TaxID=1254 RepID=UPI00270DCF83|nr:HNH endonuclease [Pediococcus acidilactici]MDO7802349.1 HNH endonuclease [Pediococcus acidilactici]